MSQFRLSPGARSRLSTSRIAVGTLIGIGFAPGSEAAAPAERIRLPDCVVAWTASIDPGRAVLRAVAEDTRCRRSSGGGLFPDDPVHIECDADGAILVWLSFDDPEANPATLLLGSPAHAYFTAGGASFLVSGEQGVMGFDAAENPLIPPPLPPIGRDAFLALIKTIATDPHNLSIAVEGRIGWDIRITTLPGREAESEGAIQQSLAACEPLLE